MVLVASAGVISTAVVEARSLDGTRYPTWWHKARGPVSTSLGSPAGPRYNLAALRRRRSPYDTTPAFFGPGVRPPRGRRLIYHGSPAAPTPLCPPPRPRAPPPSPGPPPGSPPRSGSGPGPAPRHLRHVPPPPTTAPPAAPPRSPLPAGGMRTRKRRETRGSRSSSTPRHPWSRPWVRIDGDAPVPAYSHRLGIEKQASEGPRPSYPPDRTPSPSDRSTPRLPLPFRGPYQLPGDSSAYSSTPNLCRRSVTRRRLLSVLSLVPDTI